MPASARALCPIALGSPGASASASGLGAVLSGLGTLGPVRSLDSALIDAATGARGTAARSCQTGAAASLSGEPAVLASVAPDRSAANPFDALTGAKYEQAIDVALPAVDQFTALDAQARAGALVRTPTQAPGLVMQFARHYHSTQDYALALGRGWSHSFDTRLARRRLERAPGAGLAAAELQILQADGRRVVMRPAARQTLADGPPIMIYHATEAADGVVEERYGPSGMDWLWRWPSGRALRFDAAGRLAEITAPDLDRLTLHYDRNGRLARIADRHGRSLALRYSEGQLVELVLPDAQSVRYHYDSNRRLTAVRYPDGRLVQYHYEDARGAHWLTGITHADGVISRYRYDDSARVIESLADVRDPDTAIRARYERTGSAHHTWLTHAGGVTSYRWQMSGVGRASLLAAEGAACERCPSAGSDTRYDARGRLVAFGVWRLTYDSHDRISALIREAGGHREHWRVFYASEHRLAQPSRMEAPSVVPGQVRTLHFAYNPRGQLTEFIESGLAPYSDGDRPVWRWQRLIYAEAGAEEGKLIAIERHEPAEPLARASLGAQSKLLAQTRFVYDGLRRLQSIQAPLGIEHTISRDALGRPVAEALPDGRAVARVWDASWQLAGLKLGEAAWQITRDRAGRLRAIDWATSRRLAFDPATRELSLTEYGEAVLRTRIAREDEARVAKGAQGIVSDSSVMDQHADRVITQASPALIPMGLIISGPSLQQVDAAGRVTHTRWDDLGRVIEERSDERGLRQVWFDTLDRPVQWTFADGASESRRYDAAGRLIVRDMRTAHESEQTEFHWQGLALSAVTHPHGSLRIDRDRQMRMTRLSQQLGERWLDIRLDYDEAGRLRTRSLGDGLVLSYRYDAQGRAIGLDLIVPGRSRPVALIEQVIWRGGRIEGERLGAGLMLERKWEAGRLTELTWRRASDAEPFERFALRRDSQGLVHTLVRRDSEERFAFDAAGRLIVRERHEAGSPFQRDYRAYSAAGDLLLSRDEGGRTQRWEPVVADAMGRPLAHGPWRLHYGLSGRIEAMVQSVPTAHAAIAVNHRYNAFGERVVKRVVRANGTVEESRFLYYQQALAAETDGSGRIRRHFIGWQGRPLAIIEVSHDWRGRPQPRIHWLISDHLGSPHAAVDARARIVWRARYSAFGELLAETGSVPQPLRWPGQYHDRETGLYDNYRRTYDPVRGRYLEPDPLGLAGGWNLYAYAEGNPVQASDPLGLILFAFDGTGNSDPARAPDTLSNVAKFVSLYAGEDSHYMSGVGTLDTRSGIHGGLIDTVDAASARRRVDHMLGVLDTALRSPETEGDAVDVNVVGFSRGAAMARDFANAVAGRIRSGHYLGLRRCVSLNFIGLWDTVAQFGLSGSANPHWNLGIPAEAKVVVHAVAVHESRRFYPLESIGASGSTPTGGVRLERGFIGDHGDIGGSHAQGDLSDVALGWMVEQARAAGVRLHALRNEWRIVSEPLLHDLRSVWQPGPDRVWRVPGAEAAPARRALEQAWILDRARAEPMVRRYPYRLRGVDGAASLAGQVDMAAYSAWLAEHYGQTVAY